MIFPSPPECDSVQQCATIPDDSRFSNNHSSAVIHHDGFSNDTGGMNVQPEYGAALRLQKECRVGLSLLFLWMPQAKRGTVTHERRKSLAEQQHLQRRVHGGIAAHDGLQIVPHGVAHGVSVFENGRVAKTVQ